jgi:hypothetical protein
MKRTKRTGSLFHAIVIVGASLGASCSGDDERLPPPDAPVPDVVVADARPPPDAGPPDGATDAIPDAGAPDGPDAMVIIL